MKKIYGMADFCIDGSIDDSLFKCTEKKDTKDQAQITTAAKESATQTEAAKTTSKKKRKTKRKKIKRNHRRVRKTAKRQKAVQQKERDKHNNS